jgi:oligopeptide/dipeptide ABC transporter ATP-binding protein
MDNGKDSEVLSINKLSKHYSGYGSLFNFKKNIIKAVDNVSFNVYKGDIFSIVGETGCGKSTLSKLILGLTNRSSGEIFYKGNILNYNLKKLDLRKKIQIVFQDPYSSLNPKKKIYKIVSLPAIKNKIIKKKDALEHSMQMLKKVGLDENYVFKFPHELSGGQRQRISIARSLSVNPELLVLDEPVSALDVSVSAQILNLLLDLHEKNDLTYIFITHDLRLVRHMADKVCVMYGGKIMEISPVDKFFDGPLHPYSRVLLESILAYGPKNILQFADAGNININNINAATGIEKNSRGCVYYNLCSRREVQCIKNEPELKEYGDVQVNCFFPYYSSV